ncbi:uncharacterized protein ASPGLDRAFT_1390475 [Aspergillus glaucus CBS 516.65]|uniref:Uncharacterized protein n=1 Tax=Aspergillus glaucus CBS 516.65 TaxID=1160497 RepID=A0A1L9VPF5_ASPGL|nr:hypothetical protein ASPGLDRAFT_1390475 [Aspergillus glaucus CBS 516.65]OJJ85786.1 hypothetical protein ASPGLDRAFT_1390475 [Aspergillus glaucus CBS 516.65]
MCGCVGLFSRRLYPDFLIHRSVWILALAMALATVMAMNGNPAQCSLYSNPTGHYQSITGTPYTNSHSHTPITHVPTAVPT